MSAPNRIAVVFLFAALVPFLTSAGRHRNSVQRGRLARPPTILRTGSSRLRRPTPQRRFEMDIRRSGSRRRVLDRRLGRYGDDGYSDNLPPPAELFVPETVPRTPLDPDVREALRATTRELDVQAVTFIESLLARSPHRSGYGVEKLKSAIDQWGGYHGHFTQLYRGVPLTKGSIVVHFSPDGGDVTYQDHFIDDFPIRLHTTPRFPESDAVGKALEWADPTGRLGHQATAELKLHPLLHPERSARGATTAFDAYRWVVQDVKLVWEVLAMPPVFDVEQQFELALQNAPVIADATADETDREENTFLGPRTEDEPEAESHALPGADIPWVFLIDAQTGVILEARPQVFHDVNQIQYPPTTGVGFGHFHSFVELNTTYWPPFNSYVLADTFRPKTGSANIVFHGRNLSIHDSAQFNLFLDQNNVWGNGLINFTDPVCETCTHSETPAVDVAYAMQQTYDFLKTVIGRWGTDDEGKAQHAVVHWGMEYTDARYNSGSGLIEFGNGTTAGSPGNYSIGTVGHEIAHAIWHEEENGTGENSAKALNEGHADILGGFVAMYESTTKGKGTWLYRLPWSKGNWRSRTRDPEGYSSCDGEGDDEICLTGERYWDPDIENSPVEHVGGIPYSRAVMHLAEGSSTTPGSSHYTVFFPDTPMRGIGLNKAAAIWHHATTYIVPKNPSYAQIWFSYLIAAEQLYGVNSMEKQAVFNAWRAVGVGPAGTDSARPDIAYAKVYDVDSRSLTARTMAIVTDDAGAELTSPDTHHVRRNNTFYGLVDIAADTPGNNLAFFRAEDSGGRSDIALRGYTRPTILQVLKNGGFEDSFFGNWTDAEVEEDPEAALFGERCANPGPVPMTQEVNLTGLINPKLSYWAVAEDRMGFFDSMTVSLLGENDQLLQVLKVHNDFSDWFPRPPHSNGYVNFQHSLAGYSGIVKIAFRATKHDLFRVDHVVVTSQGVELPNPSLHVFDSDNTLVMFVDEADVEQVIGNGINLAFYVDGVVRFPQQGKFSGQYYYADAPLNTFGLGSHFVHMVAEDANQQVLSFAGPVWFTRKSVNELVQNGGFEQGLMHWEEIQGVHYEVGDSIVNYGPYQGNSALGIGWVGSPHETSVGQQISIPFNIKSLKFTARISRSFESEGDQDPKDTLYVDFVDRQGQILVSEIIGIVPNDYLYHDPPSLLRTYHLVSFSPSVAKLSGKDVIMRLRFVENEMGKSLYRIDNVSLTYADWGLQLNN